MSVEQIEGEQRPAMRRCNFCDKSEEDCLVLVASPENYATRSYICDDCIEVCGRIVVDWVREHVAVVVQAREKAKAYKLGDHWKTPTDPAAAGDPDGFAPSSDLAQKSEIIPPAPPPEPDKDATSALPPADTESTR